MNFSKSEFNKSDAIVFSSYILIFIVSPFLSSLYSLIVLGIKRRYSTALLFSFSAALLAFVYRPEVGTDLSRWFLIYKNIADNDFENLMNWLKNRPDSLAYFFIFSASRLSLDKEFLPFAVIFSSYAIYLRIYFNEEKVSNLNKNTLLLLLIIFVFALDYRVIVLGVRQGLAVIISLYGMHSLIRNDRLIFGWGFIAIAILTHFMTAAVAFSLIASKFIDDKRTKYLMLLSLLIFLLPLDNIMQYIVGSILPSISEQNSKIVESYTTGYWGQSYFQDLSFKGRIQTYITRLPLFFSYFYLFFISESNKLRTVFVILLLVISIFSFSETLLLRYSFIITLFLPVLIFVELNDSYNYVKTKIVMVVLFLVYSLLFVSMLYSARSELAASIPDFINLHILNFYDHHTIPLEVY